MRQKMAVMSCSNVQSPTALSLLYSALCRESALRYLTEALTLDPDAVHVVKLQVDTAEFLANSGQSDKALELLRKARDLVSETTYAKHHKRRKEDVAGIARDGDEAVNNDTATAAVGGCEDDAEENKEGREENEDAKEAGEGEAGGEFDSSSSPGDSGDDNYVKHEDDVVKNIHYGIELLEQGMDREDKKMKERCVPGHTHKVADARAKIFHPDMRLYFVHRKTFNLFCDSCGDIILVSWDDVDPAEITCFRCVKGCSYDICERCIIRRGARLRIIGVGPA